MNWRGFAVFLTALLALSAPASAHRLDENLQATTISIEADHINVELRLTAGVTAAQRVLADLDANADGNLSSAEQQALAASVAAHLEMSIDGKGEALRLVASAFPTVEAIEGGTGNIILSFQTDRPATSGGHALTLDNRYRSDISVYLVNTLVPPDPSIQVTGQDRSYGQASYHLDFTTGASGAGEIGGQLAGSFGMATAMEFFWDGVTHILTGYDHLLFVAALALGASTLWDLVKVAAAFTVAHSLTLTLAALQLVQVPGAIVEPLISASIVFVEVQNIVWPAQAKGWGRLAIAFVFGLFHGLGFAGGLLDLMNQMPGQTILIAIVAFSLGIEAGNQLVILPTYGVLKLLREGMAQRSNADWTRQVQRFCSAAISIAGAYYLYSSLSGGT